jgi:hypothetical protein
MEGNQGADLSHIVKCELQISCHPSASSPSSQASTEGIYEGKSMDRPHHIVKGELGHATHLRHLLLVRHPERVYIEGIPGTDLTYYQR